jgi:PAS domain-containing protein
MPKLAALQPKPKAIRGCSPQRRKPHSPADELWEVSSHLDLVLNSLTDHAIITLDVNGIITSWNRGAQRTKGYDQSEIIGCHFSCFYSKEDQAAGLPMRALALAERASTRPRVGAFAKPAKRFGPAWSSIRCVT